MVAVIDVVKVAVAFHFLDLICHGRSVVLDRAEVCLAFRPELNDALSLVHAVFNAFSSYIVLCVHRDDRAVLYKQRKFPQRCVIAV